MTSVMTHKGYQARIEYDDDDGILFGKIAGITDSVSFHGETVTELRAAFHEAVDDYVETCAKIGKEPQKSFSGKMMFRVSPEVHRSAAIAAELAGVSLNQWAEDALRETARRSSYHVLTTMKAQDIVRARSTTAAGDEAVSRHQFVRLHLTNVDQVRPGLVFGDVLMTGGAIMAQDGPFDMSAYGIAGGSVKRPKKEKAGD